MKSQKFIHFVLFLEKFLLVKLDVWLRLYFLCTVILVNDYFRASRCKFSRFNPDIWDSAEVKETHVEGTKTKISSLDTGTIIVDVFVCDLGICII